MTELPEIWRDQFLEVREVPGQGLCGVQRFVYTCGLLTNLTFDGPWYSYAARYCYPARADALAALAAWDGLGDPPGGWVKEKVTERTPDGGGPIRDIGPSVITLHVIYARPRDLPMVPFVVRAQTVHRCGAIVPHRECHVFQTLGEAREHCERLGLFQMARDPGDEPQIVESWM